MVQLQINCLQENEKLARIYEKPFDSSTTGSWRIIVTSLIDEVEHLALIKGVVTSKNDTTVRVHSFNPIVDVLEDLNAMAKIIYFQSNEKIDRNKRRNHYN